METEKTSLETQNQPSCLGGVSSRYIDKADAYLDANFNTQGGNHKLRAIGNKQSQQLAKIYCDAYEQALKDNGL
jgi:hypothetical protein